LSKKLDLKQINGKNLYSWGNPGESEETATQIPNASRNPKYKGDNSARSSGFRRASTEKEVTLFFDYNE
jgi:hypothetical protein